MIVRRFLAWSQTVPAAARAEGAGALARAYLHSRLDAQERHDAEAALTVLLEDPSPLVRHALADVLADAPDAPRHCVLMLANDRSDIAARVLGRSPLLRDAELVDCVAMGDSCAQTAIARRRGLSAMVAAALAEKGGVEALVTLAANASADLPEACMQRMLRRFGEDGGLREALLARPDLPSAVHADIVAATATALSAHVSACGGLTPERATRVARDATEKATTVIAARAGEDDPVDGALEFVRHLRQSKRLSVALVLRALLGGDRGFLEAALVELAGLPVGRVAGLVQYPEGAGFAALYQRAGLPADLLPVFRAILAALGEAQPGQASRLSRGVVARALAACAPPAAGATSSAAETAGPAENVIALLRRFEAEAAQEEARDTTAGFTLAAAPASPARATARLDRPALQIDLAALEAELALAA